LFVQFRYFIKQQPVYEAFLREQISLLFAQMESHFSLEKDSVLEFVNQMMIQTSQGIQEKAMPMVFSNSMPMLLWMIEAVTVSLVTFVAVVFISRDYDSWKNKKKKFFFAEELGILGQKLMAAGGAYVRAQLILMLLVSLVCIWGFIFLKSPYALLLGLGIGLMDALPLLGTGLVFIPWIIVTLIFGEWKRAVGLLVIYVICYLMREFLEPRLMGRQMGITSLEMIISMYIGLRLFGLVGVVLGPVGYLIIKETVML
jgi:sporulation integral membrane protein YtvI